MRAGAAHAALAGARRAAFMIAALLAQGEALAHAEAMLLVHHRQREVGKIYRVFDQRVGADGKQQFARAQALCHHLLERFLQAAGEPRHLEAERRQPAGKLPVVLFGKDFSRRHQRRLRAMFGGAQHRQRGHDGLAAAHVALQQALHRVRAGEIVLDLMPRPLLGAGQAKRQLCQQGGGQRAAGRQRRRVLRPARGVGFAQRDLLRQQFVELHALPGRMRAIFEGGERRFRGRVMQRAQAVGKRRQPVALAQGLGQRVVEILVLERAIDQFAQRRLGQAGGGRIDRRHRVRQRRAGVDGLDPRMDQIDLAEAGAGLAKDAQVRAHRHQLDRVRVEVEKAQGRLAAGIAHAHQQLASRPRLDRAIDDLGFELHRHAVAHVADRGDAGLVFVTQRQVGEQRRLGMDAQPREARRQRVAGGSARFRLSQEPGRRRPRPAHRAATPGRRPRRAPDRAARNNAT